MARLKATALTDAGLQAHSARHSKHSKQPELNKLLLTYHEVGLVSRHDGRVIEVGEFDDMTIGIQNLDKEMEDEDYSCSRA